MCKSKRNGEIELSQNEKGQREKEKEENLRDGRDQQSTPFCCLYRSAAFEQSAANDASSDLCVCSTAQRPDS